MRLSNIIKQLPLTEWFIYTHSFILSLSREASVNETILQSSSTFVSLDTGRSHCLVPSRGRLGSVAKNPIKSFPNVSCNKNWVLFVDLWISRKQKRDSDSVSGCMSEVWLLLAPAVYLVGRNLAHIININPHLFVSKGKQHTYHCQSGQLWHPDLLVNLS